MTETWTTQHTLVLCGYIGFVCALAGLQLWLDSKRRQLLQVQAVRERLRAAVTPPLPAWRVTVQLHDTHAQIAFTSRVPLAAGDFVEAQVDGTLRPANLLSSQRIVGVVVACEVAWLASGAN